LADFVGLPQQLSAVAIITANCTQQLNALAQAHGRSDLQDEVPRLTTTARNAAKLARDMLDGLLERLPKQRPSKIVEAKPASMQTGCPWILSRGAVREYRTLRGGGISDAVARAELEAMALDCVTSSRVPRELPSGLIQFRGPKPLRLRLVVAPPDRHSNERSKLIQVLPEHEAQHG
jgi:hypothetical protein